MIHSCRVCGRELTDPVSIRRGIGPECFRDLKLELAWLRKRLETCPEWARRAYRRRLERIKKLLEDTEE